MRIRLGFSPAPDGGVMFCALAAGRIDTGDLEIDLVSASLPALNDRASRGELEATMISTAAYPYLRERYVLARCGACFAAGRGPILAAREPLKERDLADARIAVPDSTGSATLALLISRPGIRTRLLPADKIALAAKIGLADCALLPHGDDGRIRQLGLHWVEDVAAGWAKATGQLPLPLTCLAIRNDLPEDVRLRIEEVLRASIRYGLEHRAEAEAFAANCARDGGGPVNGTTLGLYVSETTVDMGAPEREAIEELLRRGHAARIVPQALPIRFVGGEA